MVLTIASSYICVVEYLTKAVVSLLTAVNNITVMHYIIVCYFW